MHYLKEIKITNHSKTLNLPESVYNDDVIHHNDDPWEITDNEYEGNHYENNRQALLTCTVARSSQFIGPGYNNFNLPEKYPGINKKSR